MNIINDFDIGKRRFSIVEVPPQCRTINIRYGGFKESQSYFLSLPYLYFSIEYVMTDDKRYVFWQMAVACSPQSITDMNKLYSLPLPNINLRSGKVCLGQRLFSSRKTRKKLFDNILTTFWCSQFDPSEANTARVANALQFMPCDPSQVPSRNDIEWWSKFPDEQSIKGILSLDDFNGFYWWAHFPEWQKLTRANKSFILDKNLFTPLPDSISFHDC